MTLKFVPVHPNERNENDKNTKQKVRKNYPYTKHKIAHKNSILYFELAPLACGVNTLQTLEIRGNSR